MSKYKLFNKNNYSVLENSLEEIILKTIKSTPANSKEIILRGERLYLKIHPHEKGSYALEVNFYDNHELENQDYQLLEDLFLDKSNNKDQTITSSKSVHTNKPEALTGFFTTNAFTLDEWIVENKNGIINRLRYQRFDNQEPIWIQYDELAGLKEPKDFIFIEDKDKFNRENNTFQHFDPNDMACFEVEKNIYEMRHFGQTINSFPSTSFSEGNLKRLWGILRNNKKNEMNISYWLRIKQENCSVYLTDETEPSEKKFGMANIGGIMSLSSVTEEEKNEKIITLQNYLIKHDSSLLQGYVAKEKKGWQRGEKYSLNDVSLSQIIKKTINNKPSEKYRTRLIGVFGESIELLEAQKDKYDLILRLDDGERLGSETHEFLLYDSEGRKAVLGYKGEDVELHLKRYLLPEDKDSEKILLNAFSLIRNDGNSIRHSYHARPIEKDKKESPWKMNKKFEHEWPYTKNEAIPYKRVSKEKIDQWEQELTEEGVSLEVNGEIGKFHHQVLKSFDMGDYSKCFMYERLESDAIDKGPTMEYTFTIKNPVGEIDVKIHSTTEGKGTSDKEIKIYTSRMSSQRRNTVLRQLSKFFEYRDPFTQAYLEVK